MKKILPRKRRNGVWYSMGQGNGSVQDQNDDGNSSGDDDDDDLDDDDDSGDDGKGGKAKKDKENNGDDPEKAKLSQEAARRRRQAREFRTERDAFKAELDEIKNKDKPELDRIKGEHETVVKERDQLKGESGSLRLRNAFLEAVIKAGVDPAQLEFAEFKFSKSKIDVDDAGDDLMDEVEAALKSVIAETPGLVPKKRTRKASEDDDDDDDEDENQGTTGRTAPAMNNGRRKPGKETPEQRKARLARKFPALQGR